MQNFTVIKPLLPIWVSLLVLVGCTAPEPHSKSEKKPRLIPAAAVPASNNAVPVQSAADRFTYAIIPAGNNTFGYAIKDAGKILIRQNTIPGLPGNNAFSTEENAAKVAQLVIDKLNNGEMPPSVNFEEMKNLKVLP